jgi:hypothetical protein
MDKKLFIKIFFCASILSSSMFAQSRNCFLEDFTPRIAVVPSNQNASVPAGETNVNVLINSADTTGKISKYIFGNAHAVWVGNGINNPTIIKYLNMFSPTFIRFPGGSWSDIFFWNGIPNDIPDSLIDGTSGKKDKFYPQSGKGSWPTTVDNFYAVRDQSPTEILITVNYGYARYGTSDDPVATAAHLAAEWVRYDDGRTRFWEIGNENAGPWEAGWQIDPKTNKDGQPAVITGELYGKHFKVFADSMRKAAIEIGVEIFIGGQINHFDGTTSWNIADRKWNESFLKEGAPYADFYVMHNYFGTAATATSLLENPLTEVKKNIEFIRQDIVKKNAPDLPVAITEYNMQGSSSAFDLAKTSFINGMQSIILFNEFIKYNFGLSSRWLLATGSTGMFYDGSDTKIPKWNPRPEFFYLYYVQKFIGDHTVKSVSSDKDILAYSSKFSRGETGVIIVNKGTTDRVVKLSPTGNVVGDKYYVYSLTGGTDHPQFSQNVYVNGEGPTGLVWGPLDILEHIPADAFTIQNEIKVESPALSVQFVLIEKGDRVVSMNNENENPIPQTFSLEQNYPNPFNPEATIRFSIPAAERPLMASLRVYDILGREIATLVNEEKQPGNYSVNFSFKDLKIGGPISSSVYFYKLQAGDYSQVKKMIMMK